MPQSIETISPKQRNGANGIDAFLPLPEATAQTTPMIAPAIRAVSKTTTVWAAPEYSPIAAASLTSPPPNAPGNIKSTMIKKAAARTAPPALARGVPAFTIGHIAMAAKAAAREFGMVFVLTSIIDMQRVKQARRQANILCGLTSKIESISRTSNPKPASAAGYANGIFSPQVLHLPFSSAKPRNGTR